MSKKPYILGDRFFPKKAENKMSRVDDVASSREDFIKNRPGNLDFLLEKRYLWMNDWINEEDIGIEVGCGNGLSEFYITSKNFTLTDFSDYYWVQQKVDALDMPYKDNSLDYIISSNMIHHLALPHLFFNECNRVLKPGGVILIQEVNASLFMRLLLRLMKHEGYNYDIDPFDPTTICNDPDDLWSGNNALPNLLFDEKDKFESHFNFNFLKDRFCEFSIFLISGGVTAKVKTINLPRFILKTCHLIDTALIFAFKDIFALERQIVLRKREDEQHPGSN